jgi:hypothetical protein
VILPLLSLMSPLHLHAAMSIVALAPASGRSMLTARLGGIIGIRTFSLAAFLLSGSLWFAAFCLAWRLISDSFESRILISPSAPNIQTIPVDIKIKEGAVTMFGGSRRPWVLAIPDCVAMLLFRDAAWLSGRVCRENCYNLVVILKCLQISSSCSE